ncbi:DUF4276 family protein [Brevibacterium album]|uniref:DUF4276 family protein n=1 Tax=Brevibacterium album TaxID=417948 RepID=UPI000421A6B8|nr:DUF4276 family protein [Brevibacterium album]
MTEGKTLTFLLVREGATDDALVDVIRKLIERCAGNAVFAITGDRRTYRGRPAAQLEAVRSEGAELPNLVFVHHDSDSRDHTGVEKEIMHAATTVLGETERIIPVIPVQETEAWMLADEELIQSVVGRSEKTYRSREQLKLPPVSRIEETASPKEVLRMALVLAGKEGAKAQKKTKQRFDAHREQLLENIELDGPIAQLPSWQRFVVETERAVEACLRDEAGEKLSE